jgi:transcriptional regulator GlxA family with amidase domain
MTLVAASQIRDVAIIVFEGVELLDFTGPYEVFHGASGYFRVSTVARSTDMISSNAGLQFKPSASFDNCPAPDIIVIPGGHVRALTDDDKAMVFLRKSMPQAEVVMSVCNGAMVLAELEVLDGLTVTTHHGNFDNLRRRAPKATVVEDRKWVDNGKIIAAAGVSSGIDATLHLIERLHGAEMAQGVERYIEYSRRAQ